LVDDFFAVQPFRFFERELNFGLYFCLIFHF